MRVLIIAPNWIGDAVMSLSLIQALVAYYHKSVSSNDSKLQVHVLAPLITAPVYRFSPDVHTVHEADFKHGQLQFFLRRKVGRTMKEIGFDEVYVLPNTFKAALLAWFSGAAKRIGYEGECRGRLLNASRPRPKVPGKLPMTQWYCALGGFWGEGALPWPKLRVETEAMSSQCKSFNLDPGFLAIAAGAEYGPAKRWSSASFAKVAAAFLQANPTQKVALFGGPKDLHLSNEVLYKIAPSLRRRVAVLAGETRLSQAVELLSGAGALVTNDSGLMHVAAALDRPLEAIFGSSSPDHTPPLSQAAKVHYLGLSCSPCFQRKCPLKHTNCLKQIHPNRVIDSLLGTSDVKPESKE